MAKRQLPPIPVLRQLLRYEPETGKLFWNERADPRPACWNSKYAGKEAFTAVMGSYRQGSVYGAHLSAHRLVWALHYGEWPTGLIDHIDGNGTNNRLVNLRCVDDGENARNTRVNKRNTSGYQGVYRTKNGKWHARLYYDRRSINLGTFASIEDAAACRKAAERLYGFHPNHGRVA